MSDKDNEMNVEGMLINAGNIDEIISKAIDDTDAEVRAEKEAKRKEMEAAAEAAAHKIEKKPLFTILATEISKSDIEGTAVTGMLHGKVVSGDVVYIMRPDLRIMRRTATAITVEGERVTEAANCRLTLHIGDISDPLKITKFSVISNIEPTTNPELGMPIENPQLLGMTWEAGDYTKDADFMKALTLQIWSARYVLPCRREIAADGKKRIGLIPVPDPKNKEKIVLPVFTDYRTLSLWKKVFEGSDKRETVVMSFRSLASAVGKQEFKGVMINMFGPKPLFLSKEIIMKFLSSDEFRWRFGGQDDRIMKSSEKKETDEKQKVVLGVPPITEETVIVKRQMTEYAKKHAEISEMYLLLKLDENNEKRYFVIVDENSDKPEKLYGGLFMSCGRYLEDMKGIEFLPKEKAEPIKQLLEKTEPFYKK